jgi:hypothetical protein
VVRRKVAEGERFYEIRRRGLPFTVDVGNKRDAVRVAKAIARAHRREFGDARVEVG